MIVIIIGTVLSATPAPLVEVQDTVVLVAQDLANEVITIRNEMVGYIPTAIVSLPECCQPTNVNNELHSGIAINNEKILHVNPNSPIRGSPAI